MLAKSRPEVDGRGCRGDGGNVGGGGDDFGRSGEEGWVGGGAEKEGEWCCSKKVCFLRLETQSLNSKSYFDNGV